MKKNILSMAALLIASTTFVACSSDDNIIDQQPAQSAGQQVYTMTVNAQKGGDAATSRALTLSGKTLNATWATTENVYVKKGDTWATGSLQPDANAATATLKGELTGITIAADDVLTLQFPKSGEISYTGQVGTLEDIAADFDYATATVTVASVSATGNIIPEAATTTFENQQAIVKFTLINKADGTTSLSASELTVSDGANTYTVTPASATSEIYAAIPGFSGKTVTLTATVGGKTYTYEKSGVTFANGKFYSVTVKMTAQASTPTGALSGKFSVSAGKQVYFSKGNLQYIGSASTPYWKFADHQYDYLGTTTSQDSSTETVDRDLFCWGTSGSAPSGQTARAPYYTTTNRAHYVSNITTDGTSWGVGSEWDWGHNAISNGGNTADAWRTLTKDEWLYLFGMESINIDKSGHARYRKYFRATVNEVIGIVVLPDDISGISDIPEESSRGTASTFEGKTYTTDAWATLESAGCVFLPAAGYRRTKVYYVGSNGYYWSSTASGTYYAYYVYFDSGAVSPARSNDRDFGFSVRLVRDAQ